MKDLLNAIIAIIVAEFDPLGMSDVPPTSCYTQFANYVLAKSQP